MSKCQNPQKTVCICISLKEKQLKKCNVTFRLYSSYSGFVLLNEWRICPLTCLLSIFVQYVDLRHLFYSLYIIQHPAIGSYWNFSRKINSSINCSSLIRYLIPSVTRLKYTGNALPGRVATQLGLGPIAPHALPFSLLTLTTHTSKKYE